MSKNESNNPAARARKPSATRRAVDAVNRMAAQVADGDIPVTGTSEESASVTGTYDRDPNRAEFFGFSRGNSVFSFDPAGHVISRKLMWPSEPAVAPVERKQFILPFDIDGSPDGLRVPLGIVAISGPTGLGKSTLARAMAKVMNIQRLLAVEPHDDGYEVANVPTFSSVDGAFAAAVAMSYSNPETLCLIDSLRAPLFETTGAAGSKGVIMPFFTQLTRVSNCLAMAGITLVVTVNPMDEDPDYVKSFLSKLSASVPTVILLESMSRSGDDRSFTGSVQMRPNRRPRQFRFSTSPSKKRDTGLGDDLHEIAFEPVSTNQSMSIVPRSLINAFNKAI